MENTLDAHLNLSENFNKKYKKTLSKLRLLSNSHLLSTKAVTLTYDAIILPAIKFNCITDMKLTMGQEKKFSSLDDCAWLVTKSNTNSIKGIMEKHTVLLVQKCLDWNAWNTFNKYFEFNHHNKSTRNNVLLKVPRVKLEIAKAGFFFYGSEIL